MADVDIDLPPSEPAMPAPVSTHRRFSKRGSLDNGRRSVDFSNLPALSQWASNSSSNSSTSQQTCIPPLPPEFTNEEVAAKPFIYSCTREIQGRTAKRQSQVHRDSNSIDALVHNKGLVRSCFRKIYRTGRHSVTLDATHQIEGYNYLNDVTNQERAHQPARAPTAPPGARLPGGSSRSRTGSRLSMTVPGINRPASSADHSGMPNSSQKGFPKQSPAYWELIDSMAAVPTISSQRQIDETSSVEIDQAMRDDGSVMEEFSDLAKFGEVDDGLMQCLQLHGFNKPRKLQQHAIPAINLSLRKSSIVVQGPARSGKTSSLILSLLATIDPSVPFTQAILLTSIGKRDFEKYIDAWPLKNPVTYQAFHDTTEELDLNSPEVKAASSAQILIGHPTKMLRLLSEHTELVFHALKILAVDDAEDIINEALENAPSHKVNENPIRAPSRGQTQKPLVDYVIQIRQALEGLQSKLKYVILSQPLMTEALEKVLRVLKSSHKLNQEPEPVTAVPPSIMEEPPPLQFIKAIKHYCVAGPKTNWLAMLCKLFDETLLHPHALVYCDEEVTQANGFLEKMQSHQLSVNEYEEELSSTQKSSETSKVSKKNFSGKKGHFLVTNPKFSCELSEPVISCLFHMDSSAFQGPLTYGVRMHAVNETCCWDSISVLFVEPEDQGLVELIEEKFAIKFKEIPFDVAEISHKEKKEWKRSSIKGSSWFKY